jgi:hypothetical protein
MAWDFETDPEYHAQLYRIFSCYPMTESQAGADPTRSETQPRMAAPS